MRTNRTISAGITLVCLLAIAIAARLRAPGGGASTPLDPFAMHTVQARTKKPKPFVSADTPIKVGGGAMTFFSEKDWKPVNGGFCTAVLAADITNVTVERWFDGKGNRVDTPGKDNAPVFGMSAWTIKLTGHKDKEGQTPTPSSDYVTMQASSTPCDGSAPSVSITPGGNGGFYPDEVPAGGQFKHNRRFAVASNCSDRDLCERVEQAEFSDGSGKLIGTYTCPDGECRISVGNP